ncbi:hypothetical protein Taro_028143 [Colocasia esculenta]|uniref:non-specific serine/threonine protein kinase n=1 Tax=Colocasia esculenta TaxID=4460 RepID=A0A843VTC3_COLES|nr:hypothetical protein [Colocasia esculenta]
MGVAEPAVVCGPWRLSGALLLVLLLLIALCCSSQGIVGADAQRLPQNEGTPSAAGRLASRSYIQKPEVCVLHHCRSLLGNRISGSIPEEIGKITTLQSLVLENNMLEGRLPQSLGNLTSLTRLLLSANYFTGELPEMLGNLKNVADLYVLNSALCCTLSRIDGNDIWGKIPHFIGNWTQLQRLLVPKLIGSIYMLFASDMQGTSLEGPFPSNISLLQRLAVLRVTDLKKSDGSFPPIWNMKSMRFLVLRNCSISGQIPGYIGEMTSLLVLYGYMETNCFNTLMLNCSYLDLSFNKLTGTIPSSLENLRGNIGNMYLTNNELNGSIPDWIRTSTMNLDVSYNTFTDTTSAPSSCRAGSLNFVASFSSTQDSSINPCLRKGLPCAGKAESGKKVLKDFNIAAEANGTGKGIVKVFTTLVMDNTLEIHFQWTGKGTNAIPYRGVYGPLLSAISVTPNFAPDLDKKKFPLSALLGSLAASCVLSMLILVLLWFCLRRKLVKKNVTEIKPILIISTHGKNQGVLPDGSLVTVKQHSSKSKQGNRLFVYEVGMISALQHPNLVKLFGCCIGSDQLLLVYEYMENNSLARALFGSDHDMKLKLDWQTRHKICQGVARGLAYLHEESILKIVHRDIKATNILLDKDLNAKISDFALDKLDEEDNTCDSTQSAGNK